MESRQPIIETFEKYASKALVANNKDMFLYPYVPEAVVEKVKEVFRLDEDEVILYFYDESFFNKRNVGVVFTDRRIALNSVVKGNPLRYLPYENIYTAEIEKRGSGGVFFDFWDSTKEKCVRGFNWWTLIKGGTSDDAKQNAIKDLINQLAITSRKIMEKQSIYSEKLEVLRELSLDEDVILDQVKEMAEGILSYDISSEDSILVYYYLTRAAYTWSEMMRNNYVDAEYDSAEKVSYEEQWENTKSDFGRFIDSALSYMEEDQMKDLWYAELAYWKALDYQNKRDFVSATRLAIRALEYAFAPDEKDQLFRIISGKYAYGQIHTGGGYGFTAKTKEDYLRIAHEESVELWSMEDWKEEFSDKEIKNNIISDDNDAAEFVKTDMGFFSNRPYFDRQFIFTVKDIEHIAGCYDETDNIKYVIPIDEMPGDITFPFGHPQANTLYYAHPLRPHYVPVESASLALFHEKVQEICRLFQCLGATEITTRTLKGHKISETYSDNSSLEGEVGYKFFGASGSFGKGGNGSNYNERRDEMSLTQTFEPTRSPYCPDDLMWAAHDPEIQTFIKQRLNGGLLTFSKKVSSSETMNMSSHQKMEVKAAFNSLITKVTTNYNSESDNTFNEENETVWEISVVFKPITEFNESDDADCMTSQDSTTLSDQEQRYLEEYKAVLEDGEITDRERRSLDRYAVSLGISTERALQLEKYLNAPTLTKEEQDYLDEYKCMLEDGDIGERERRTLERLRNRLSLSAEKVAELEKTVCPTPSLNEEEQDYLEEYKSLLEDGEIGERERRTLERLRTRNGISAERARELEALK